MIKTLIRLVYIPLISFLGNCLFLFCTKKDISVAPVSLVETVLQQVGENRREVQEIVEYYKTCFPIEFAIGMQNYLQD